MQSLYQKFDDSLSHFSTSVVEVGMIARYRFMLLQIRDCHDKWDLDTTSYVSFAYKNESLNTFPNKYKYFWWTINAHNNFTTAQSRVIFDVIISIMIVIPVDIECLIQLAVIAIVFETFRIAIGKELWIVIVQNVCCVTYIIDITSDINNVWYYYTCRE